jgi:4-hydroxy-tetrahydrodipicolinate synthase
MTHHAQLQGIFPVLPTPFDDELRIDFDGLDRVVDRLVEARVDGLMVLGSGGENTYLTEDERAQVVARTLGRLPPELASIAGIITHGTAQAALEAKRYRDAGVSALLVGLPQYYRAPLDAVFAHYDAVTQAVDIPVLYYHYPTTMHLRLTPDAIGKLFARVPLAGIKESGLSTPELIAHRKHIGRPVRIFSGQSFSLRRALEEGAVGAICPLAVLMPRTALELVRAFRAGDERACRAAQLKLLESLRFVSGVGAPLSIARRVLEHSIEHGIRLPEGASLPHAGVKEALRALKVIDCASVRPPQAPLAAAQAARVQRSIAARAEL